LRLVVTSHFFQNIGEHQILARLVRLTRDGAALRVYGSIEVILTEIEKGNEIESLNRAQIEPTGMAERFLRFRIPS
jgi:hypothetical protein